jgi:hypothetical protein
MTTGRTWVGPVSRLERTGLPMIHWKRGPCALREFRPSRIGRHRGRRDHAQHMKPDGVHETTTAVQRVAGIPVLSGALFRIARPLGSRDHCRSVPRLKGRSRPTCDRHRATWRLLGCRFTAPPRAAGPHRDQDCPCSKRPLPSDFRSRPQPPPRCGRATVSGYARRCAIATSPHRCANALRRGRPPSDCLDGVAEHRRRRTGRGDRQWLVAQRTEWLRGHA